MTLTPINFHTYTALRDMDLTHPDVEGQFTLGQMASWSRWGESTSDLTPITAATAEEFDNLGPFSTQVVFFAINLGGDAVNANMRTWQNFHTKGHRGDSTLKNSFHLAMQELPEHGVSPAFYMTDVFKLVPTVNAQELKKKIAADQLKGIDHVGRCVEIIERELAICKEGAAGDSPVLVAMGSAAYAWLSGKGGDARIADAVDKVLGVGARSRVRRMDHYTSGAGSNQERADDIRAVFGDVITA